MATAPTAAAASTSGHPIQPRAPSVVDRTIYFLIASRETSQIVYIAAPMPSTMPINVKIGLVWSQLSRSRPPPRPRMTDTPRRIPRSKAMPILAVCFWLAGSSRPSRSASPSGSIARIATRIALAYTGADEEPDAYRRDHRSERQAHQDEMRAGGQHPVEDQAGDCAPKDRNHHDRGHLGHDLDEPQRRQLCHTSSTHSGRTPGV